MKKIIVILFLIYLPYTMAAQAVIVKGKVSTTTEAVKNALVTFFDENDTTKSYPTLTDSLGNYSIGLITGIGENTATVPTKFELAQNYPNPFTTSTAISYKLNKQSDVQVTIYNILGREVKKFMLGEQPSGVHGILWDGRNNLGEKVTTGIYFYRLNAGKESLVNKMLFTRGDDRDGNLTVSGNFVLPAQLSKVATVNNSVKSYTARIENTDSTNPRVVVMETENITIIKDTTINFQVQEGEQWHSLGLKNETVTAIAVDPKNTNIIYAGTLYDYSAGINGKLFKSIDGGITWDTLLVGGGYSEILIDPLNTNIIYALPGTIIKSKDGGQTWQSIIDGIYLDFETRLRSLAMNPKDPNELYAGTAGFFGGNLYKSNDGGLHWNKVGDDSLRDGVICIAIDPVDSRNVYTGTADRGILWKSSDAGATWFRTELGEIGTHDIYIDSQTPARVYAGMNRLGIFKSENGGMNWENFSQGLPQDCNVMKIRKYNYSRLFVNATFGEEGGIYEYSYLQNQWVKIGINNLQVQYYYSDLEVSSNPDRLYFGGHGGIYVMDMNN